VERWHNALGCAPTHKIHFGRAIHFGNAHDPARDSVVDAVYAGVSWKQCIYEDNEATGASTTAMGSNYPQYAHNDGAPHIQNIYHHNNSQNMVW
jgi:hypothetical protein